MKRIVLLLTSAFFLLAGCAKEQMTPSDLGEGLQTVTFTAAVEDGVTTKAVADGDGAAANVNRCIMEVYYDGTLFGRQVKPVTDKKASFTMQMVSNRTYTVAFWADKATVSGSVAEGFTDLYYNASSLDSISIKSGYIGNDDARDAFFASDDNFTVPQGGKSFNVNLKRPFAQMNVITSDADFVNRVSSLKPTKVKVLLKSAYTTFNAVTGVVSVPSDIEYSADVYNKNFENRPSNDTTNVTLSMDYLFASESKEVIDIDFKAGTGDFGDGDKSFVAHSFAAVPYQRNYRTNIKGALLTTTGQWNVTVDPIWNVSSTGEFDYAFTTVCDIKGANDFVANNTDKKEISVTFTSQPNDAGVPSSSTGKNAIVTSLLGQNATYNIDVASTTDVLYVGDYDYSNIGSGVTYDYSKVLPETSEKTKSASVNLVVSDNLFIGTLVVNSPSKSVSINGQTVQSGKSYHIQNLTVTEVSMNTVVIESGMIVENLTMVKGGLEIHGTVNNVILQNPAPAVGDILVRSCEGLSASVFEVLKNYIDTANGWTSKVNGTDPDTTYDIIQIDEWKYFAAKEFSNVSGNTITIMNAEELALFANKINAGVNYSGYTFEFGADINLAAHKWNPILIVEGNNGTNLTIDGKSRKISGLTIDREESFSGLFGKCFSHGTILKNIVIENPDVKQKLNEQKKAQEVGLNYTAALIAHLGCGKIDNCTVTGGIVSGEEQVGAIVGYIADGRVSNCTINGTAVSGKNRVGGLAGKVNTDSYFEVVGNTIKATVSAQNTVGGVVGQIMGNRADYKIQNNSIDVPGVNCPIGALRASQSVAFTSVLEDNITGNTWTTATYSEMSYVYPDSETKAGDQVIWNGCPPDNWQWYAASSFSSIDESNKTLSINTPEELALFAKRLNKGGSFAGYTVTIASALDMNAHYWTPINAYGCGNLSGAIIQGSPSGSINHLIVRNAVNESGETKYYTGFIGQVDGMLTIKNLTFNYADVEKTECNGAAVVIGLTYHGIVLDGVTVSNSAVKACSKVGALVGFTGGDGITPVIKDCNVLNTKVKAHYSSALLLGLANIRDDVSFEGTISTEGSSFEYSTEYTTDSFTSFKTIKGYTFGVAGSKLYVCDVCNAWSEKRMEPSPETEIEGTTYSVVGNQLYTGGRWVDILKFSPGSVVTVANAAKLASVIGEFNDATESGLYSIELAEGTYELEGVDIVQTAGKQITIKAAAGADVTVSYPNNGTAGYIFKVKSSSSYKTNANIKFKDIKFSSKAASAFTTGAVDERYVNDIDFIHCQFTTSEGATPVTSPHNSQPSGLYFENCEVTNGSGYLYSGYGNNLSTARGYAVKAVGCTAPNCKHFINVQNDGQVIVDNCTVSNYANYAIRTNGGNITVIDSDFTCTDQKTKTDCGLLVVRTGSATVTVDQLSTFDKSQSVSVIHDVQAGDSEKTPHTSATVSIVGRATHEFSGEGAVWNFPN